MCKDHFLLSYALSTSPSKETEYFSNYFSAG